MLRNTLFRGVRSLVRTESPKQALSALANSHVSQNVGLRTEATSVLPRPVSLTNKPAALPTFSRMFCHQVTVSDNFLTEPNFNHLVFGVNRGLQLAINSSKFSSESNDMLREGITAISRLLPREFYVLSDEAIKSHIDAIQEFKEGNWDVRFNELIESLSKEFKNAIIFNQNSLRFYSVNAGRFNDSPFSIGLTEREQLFLKNYSACRLIKTPSNREHYEAIEAKTKTIMGDDTAGLNLYNKYKLLMTYLAGTLIRVMHYEDIKYGPQEQFNAKLLYPFASKNSLPLYYDSMANVGAQVLMGKLLFNHDMLRPEVFNCYDHNYQPVGLNVVPMLHQLFEHFGLVSKEETVKHNHAFSR